MNQKDYWNSVAEEKKFTTVLDVELFAKYVSKNSKILDVGCGYGRILNELSESGFVDLTGIDSAEKMIKRGLREYPNLNLIVNPDGAIPFEENTFDAVILFGVLTCVPDNEAQKELLANIKRVLKPGGIIYINDFLLNSGLKRWLFYKKAQKKTGIYGAFETYDGVTVRHHAEDYILKLLSDFKTLYPEQAAGISLNENECIVISNNAGVGYVGKEGNYYKTNSDQMYLITAVVEAHTYAKIVISDQALDALTRSLLSEYLYIICDNKDAIKDFLQKDPGSTLNGKVKIDVIDDYTAAWEEKVGQTQIRLDGRTIVTATILFLSFVMLYLFQRSQVREQIGMVAVYRLLGIPGRKLGTIFCVSSFLVFIRTTLPLTVVVWVILFVLRQFEAFEIPLYLSLEAAAIGAGAILIFHILVSLLPLYRLLRQPPARLASKFDF